MLEMFKGVANSPETTITNDINNTDTIIYVLDETRVPKLPNLMVLGTGISAETIKVLSIEGNAITVERGFQGVSKAWNAGTIVARNFTEYDYNALVENIKENDIKVGALASLATLIKTSIVNAINSLKGEVDAHKAESMSYVLEIIRDTSLTGVQKISLPFKAKSIIVSASIDTTSMKCDGVWAENNMQKVKTNTSENKALSDSVAILLNQVGIGSAHGIISNVVDDGFDITWFNSDGGIGVVILFILASTHGEA